MPSSAACIRTEFRWILEYLDPKFALLVSGMAEQTPFVVVEPLYPASARWLALILRCV